MRQLPKRKIHIKTTAIWILLSNGIPVKGAQCTSGTLGTTWATFLISGRAIFLSDCASVFSLSTGSFILVVGFEKRKKKKRKCDNRFISFFLRGALTVGFSHDNDAAGLIHTLYCIVIRKGHIHPKKKRAPPLFSLSLYPMLALIAAFAATSYIFSVLFYSFFIVCAFDKPVIRQLFAHSLRKYLFIIEVTSSMVTEFSLQIIFINLVWTKVVGYLGGFSKWAILGLPSSCILIPLNRLHFGLVVLFRWYSQLGRPCLFVLWNAQG